MKLIIYNPSNFARAHLKNAGKAYGVHYEENEKKAWLELCDQEMMPYIKLDITSELEEKDGMLKIE